VISTIDKDFSTLNLLYVGTLNNRNITQTIEGLSIFLKNNPKVKNITTYDIVGDGDEYSQLMALVDKLSLNHIVKFHGRVPHFKLKMFFDRCNVGISYIPITEYYNYQPPTKTFEYILSGIPCIATQTFENQSLVVADNGILCEDTPVGFSKALKKF